MGLVETLEMRRETTRVSFLMCPFCVGGVLLKPTTNWSASRMSLT
jgi:hypothetical protein